MDSYKFRFWLRFQLRIRFRFFNNYTCTDDACACYTGNNNSCC